MIELRQTALEILLTKDTQTKVSRVNQLFEAYELNLVDINSEFIARRPGFGVAGTPSKTRINSAAPSSEKKNGYS